MTTKRGIVLAGLCALVTAAGATQARAEDRYALIVSGAAGGPAYDEQYGRWVDELSRTLTGPLGFPPDAVTVMRDGAPDAATSTAEFWRRWNGDRTVYMIVPSHFESTVRVTAEPRYREIARTSRYILAVNRSE